MPDERKEIENQNRSDEQCAQAILWQQEEIESYKQGRRKLFSKYLEYIRAYLKRCNALGQHSGINDYDVFVSYSWENQDKKRLQGHKKLQAFLKCLHDDLEKIGLKVFFDRTKMGGDMKAVMQESIERSGIVLSICKPFLQEVVRSKPEGNVAFEINCALKRAARQPEALLPLVCEGKREEALPLQILSDMPDIPVQDIGRLFEGFDPEQPFSETYMDWMANGLIPHITCNLGIARNDIFLATITQLFMSERLQKKLPPQITPHEQFEYHYPRSSAQERSAIGLQAFEFSLKRLQELVSLRSAGIQEPKKPVLVIAPSKDMGFADWLERFMKHLKLAGLDIHFWSGNGDFPENAPQVVVAVCTPDTKDAVEAGIIQPGSGWWQLQQHLVKAGVVCHPIIYEGDYKTAVPNWSKQCNSEWQKNFLSRSAEPDYYKMMVGVDPKGLLRDLLGFQDNDLCYEALYDNFQWMLSGCGTQALLSLETPSKEVKVERTRRPTLRSKSRPLPGEDFPAALPDMREDTAAAALIDSILYPKALDIKIRSTLCCPITQSLMRDPVMASDGETYEREAIENWLKEKNISPSGDQFPNKTLAPSKRAKASVLEFIEENPLLKDSKEWYLPESPIQMLSQACQSGDEAAIRALVNEDPRLLVHTFSKGAYQGKTALQLAVAGHPKAIDTIMDLLEKRAKGLGLVTLLQKNALGHSALHQAILSKQAPETLLKLMAWMGKTLSTFVLPQEWPADVDMAILNAALFLSTKRQDIAKMDCLLRLGASPNATDAGGRTPLYAAVEKGYLEAATLLLKVKADPNSRDERLDDTPFHRAIVTDSYPVAELLRYHHRSGQVPALRDGTTPLHAVAQKSSVTMADTLWPEAYTNVDRVELATPDVEGYNPLHRAAVAGSRAMVEWFLKKGADVRSVNTRRETALHLAAQHNHLEVARVLLFHNASLVERDQDGNTPLHLAVQRNALEVLVFLLESGALLMENNAGQDPRQLAEIRRQAEVVRTLDATLARLKNKEEGELKEHGSLGLTVVQQQKILEEQARRIQRLKQYHEQQVQIQEAQRSTVLKQERLIQEQAGSIDELHKQLSASSRQQEEQAKTMTEQIEKLTTKNEHMEKQSKKAEEQVRSMIENSAQEQHAQLQAMTEQMEKLGSKNENAEKRAQKTEAEAQQSTRSIGEVVQKLRALIERQPDPKVQQAASLKQEHAIEEQVRSIAELHQQLETSSQKQHAQWQAMTEQMEKLCSKNEAIEKRDKKAEAESEEARRRAFEIERQRKLAVTEKEKARLLSLQDALVQACEEGNSEAVNDLLRQGASPSRLSTKGIQPLGAAAWGTNPKVVAILLEARKEGDVLPNWEECEAHNQEQYKEVFRVETFDPKTYGEWHALLLKMSGSFFLEEKYLAEVRRIWPDESFTQSWKELIAFVEEGSRAGDEISVEECNFLATEEALIGYQSVLSEHIDSVAAQARVER